MSNVSMDAYAVDAAWGGFGGAASVGARELFQALVSDAQVLKALEATGALPRTGPGISALGVEDLSPVLASAETQAQQLYLWKESPKRPAWAIMIEGSRLDDYSSNFGATGFITTNSSGTVSDARFARYFQEIKFMAVKGQVTVPTQAIRLVTFRGVQDQAAMQVAEEIAMLDLLRHLERNLVYADSTIASEEFNGLIQQIDAYATISNRIRLDLRGQPPDKDFLEHLLEICASNSGEPTHLHIPNVVRRDLRQALFPEQRTEEGSERVVGIKFDQYLIEALGGDYQTLKIRRNQMMSRGVKGGLPRDVPSLASGNAPSVPTSVGVGVAAHTATDYAPGLDAGTYYYSVVSVNSEGGRSLATGSAAASPAAGQKVTVTITCTDPNAHFFEVYRNPAGVSGVSAANRKFMWRIGRSGNVTTWDDTGYHIPDTADALYLSMREREYVIRQLLPPLKRPLPQGLMDNSFGVLVFLTPEVPTPTHHIHIANIGQRPQSGVASV